MGIALNIEPEPLEAPGKGFEFVDPNEETGSLPDPFE